MATPEVRGRLVTSPASRHGDKVFYERDGRRHWIMDAAWVTENGFRWPDDVQTVTPEEIDALLPARSAARRWSEAEWRSPPRRGALEMREIAASQLSGSGIEIGAGANPMPLPLHCAVRYVDVYDAAGLQREIYAGQAVPDIMQPDVVAPFEDLSPIADGSIDFVVACHVIEHTTDPIGAMLGAWRKLRRGGQLVLVVPDMRRTFDRGRPLTTLDHVIEDFRHPSRERDKQHFQEFYRMAFPTQSEEFEALWRAKWEEGYPIHYHTFTDASFGEMVAWMAREVLPDFQEYWVQPAIEADPDCLEFWCVLRRR